MGDPGNIVMGILVGWAATGHGWSGGWMGKLVGAIGGLVGVFLAITFWPETDVVSRAIWAWAGSYVIGDLVSYFTSNKG